MAEGDIRAASAILRRWLGEGLIGVLCHRLGVAPSFPVLNNKAPLEAAQAHPAVDFFLTGGVKFNGVPVMFVYNSNDPPDEGPLFQLPSPPHVMVHTGEFLKQKRVYFEGSLFSCTEIITFTANKLGGVHLDPRRDARQVNMQKAAEFMTFGGPLEKMKQEPPGPLYLAVEPNAREVLSGFHIEIIAAAASFLHVHLDGQRLVDLPATRKRKTGWWRRIVGGGAPRFRFRLHER